MGRGVLLVSSGTDTKGEPFTACVIEEAFGTEVNGGMYPLNFSLKDADFLKLRTSPPAVRQAGEKLYSLLVAHENIRKVFDVTAGAEPVYPLYIRVDTPDAEELPWEILCETQKSFMVLDPDGRRPIGRQPSVKKQVKPLDRIIASELRVAVVLAAARESGVGEWSSISAAIDPLEVPVDVLGLVSEDAAKAAIYADAEAWQGQARNRNVKVDSTGDVSGSILMSRLRAHMPNIIHFFCHGVSDVFPQLELETRADRKKNEERGSIKLDSKLLRDLARIDSLWLVVLNCCQGAKTAPQLHSLASGLVAAGIPAVVAMRESVDVSDANLFAKDFYPKLFAQLQGIFALRDNPAIPKPLPFQEVVWVRAVHEARRQLSLARGRKPDSSAQWTYPVVYVYPHGLILHPGHLKSETLSELKRQELLAQLDLLRELRDKANYVIDAEALVRRAELDTKIRELEAQLAGQ
jgi:hypothetical protein